MESTDFKWKMNTMPKSDDKNLPIMDVKEVERAKTFNGGKLFITKVDNLDNEMIKTGMEFMA